MQRINMNNLNIIETNAETTAKPIHPPTTINNAYKESSAITKNK